VVEEWVEAEVQARLARLIRQGARLNRTASGAEQTEIAAAGSQFELLASELPACDSTIAERPAPPSVTAEPVITDDIIYDTVIIAVDPQFELPVGELPPNESLPPSDELVFASSAVERCETPSAIVEPTMVERPQLAEEPIVRADRQNRHAHTRPNSWSRSQPQKCRSSTSALRSLEQFVRYRLRGVRETSAIARSARGAVFWMSQESVKHRKPPRRPSPTPSP
jgi:hypothetical protein